MWYELVCLLLVMLLGGFCAPAATSVIQAGSVSTRVMSYNPSKAVVRTKSIFTYFIRLVACLITGD